MTLIAAVVYSMYIVQLRKVLFHPLRFQVRRIPTVVAPTSGTLCRDKISCRHTFDDCDWRRVHQRLSSLPPRGLYGMKFETHFDNVSRFQQNYLATHRTWPHPQILPRALFVRRLPENMTEAKSMERMSICARMEYKIAVTCLSYTSRNTNTTGWRPKADLILFDLKAATVASAHRITCLSLAIRCHKVPGHRCQCKDSFPR